LWTARGLFAFARMKKDDAFRGKVAEHAKGSLLDFLAQQSAEGRVPTMMNPTNPDHFGSLNPTHNQAKPVMAQLALLIADETGDAGWATPLLEKLVAFHAAWLKTNRSQIGLLVWSNGIGLGNDNDPTSSGRPPFSSANPLLNCMFYEDLRAVAELAGRLGMSARRDELAAQADAFGKLIQTAQWDPRDKFFYTQDVLCSDDRAKYLPNAKEGMAFSWKSLPLRIATFTGFLPLWVGVATAAQAKALLDTWWRGDDRFHAAYGCRTLSDRETMYELVYSGNPSDWLGPIWTIANYLVWRGLKKYGTAAEADELAQATIRMLAKDLAEHGSLNEYYHPDTGEALSHAGFMDWNLLVLEMMG
jgi:putative isomerase